jgi:hypothetical protein
MYIQNNLVPGILRRDNSRRVQRHVQESPLIAHNVSLDVSLTHIPNKDYPEPQHNVSSQVYSKQMIRMIDDID